MLLLFVLGLVRSTELLAPIFFFFLPLFLPVNLTATFPMPPQGVWKLLDTV